MYSSKMTHNVPGKSYSKYAKYVTTTHTETYSSKDSSKDFGASMSVGVDPLLESDKDSLTRAGGEPP